MTSQPKSHSAGTNQPGRVDSLAASVVLMLVLTVVQRGFGFFREVFFCRWLSPQDLGEWNLAFGFLTLAAPVAMLGIPGSFGRYVAQYRQRGQLRLFLRRTIVAAAAGSVLFVLAIALWPTQFSRLVFGNSEQVTLTLWVAAALATLIANNFVISLLISLRRTQAVNWIQFSQSMIFAALSLCLLGFGQPSPTQVTIAFTFAFGLTSVAGWMLVIRSWQETSADAGAEPLGEFWRKLAMFAVWIWCTNLLSNLFDVIDRWMLVHYSSLSDNAALAQVGNYHSSRIVPLMFAMVAGMFADMALPHLAHEWEAGRRDQVRADINRALKLMAVALLTGGALLELGGDFFFSFALRGKYPGGLAVLPWTAAYCTWMGLCCVAQNYLWCQERARVATIARALGLVVNIGINLYLVPIWGLFGAVFATAIANLLVLLVLMWLGKQADMNWQWTTIGLAISPLALGLGPVAAVAALFMVAVGIFATEWIVTSEEKRTIALRVQSALQHIPVARFRKSVTAQ
jgi:O-antigen/teichoic acid export membrane protein